MTRNDRESVVKPADFSALTNFFRGYLHQDLAATYGSPLRAAHAFRQDADERETAIVRGELERFLNETSRLPDADLFQIIEQLGSSWQFHTRRELEELRDALK